MGNEWIGFIVVVLAILGSHAILHRDFSRLEVELKERMAKLEGAFEGFMNRGVSK